MGVAKLLLVPTFQPQEAGLDPRPRNHLLPAIMGIPAEVMARLGEPKSLEGLSPEEIQAIVKEYYDRWIAGEDEKYDLEIQELEMEVSDMRGKFIIPKLKKVHAFKLM